MRQLARRLVATPALELRVADVSGDTALLRPAAPLRRGQVYRFELVRADGTTEAAWAVQAAWPLRVASTLPRDATSDVPRDTGIEITFDQPGVRLADLRSNFSITPAVAGRFEQHGLTFVFVPADPLARSRLYTVIVRHGLPLPGTGMTLADDAVIRFETTGAKVSRVHMTAARALFDAATDERPVVSVRLDADYDDENGAPAEQVTQLAVRVHRLPGLTAAIDAYRRLRAAPDWTVRTSTTPVDTVSLGLVVRGTLRLHPFEDESVAWLRVPKVLRAGWYVVTLTHAGISRQTILQVTDLAAFSMVSGTRSLVWVNSLRTNQPVAGARVSIAGRSFGRTDAEGLVVGRSPASLVADAEDGTDSFAIVRSGGRTVFTPLARNGYCYGCASDSDDDWWHLLTLDRERYRVSDTINVWGVVRDRDTLDVPGSVDVRLVADDYGGSVSQPAVASASATPDGSGAFLARLTFADIPAGSYTVSVRVGGTTVAAAWLEIGPIAKPAWRIALSTPHRAVLSGTSVPVAAAATFYEGTPVVGADLRYVSSSDDDDDAGSVPIIRPTGTAGTATASLMLRLGEPDEYDTEQWSEVLAYVRANEPEEGDVSADLPIMVFRSTAVLDAESTLTGRRLVVWGGVHDVVFDRYDVPGVDLWAVDPRGDPRAGASVALRVTEVIPIVRKTGTRYDFIAKRTVPVYEVSERKVELGTRRVTTGADGTFRMSMTVTGGDRWYVVRARYTDEGGRRIMNRSSAWAERSYEDNEPYVASTATGDGYGEYHVGDTVSVRFRNGIEDAQVNRYLFAVMARGLRSVSVQDGGRFATRFTRGLVPNARIAGVRFTGTGYEVDLSGFDATLRTADRSLDVRLTADRARYVPGDRATITIRTLDASGRPVSASVFVRAIDEKLFTIGAARVDDPLGALYASTGSGLLASAWSHASPDPGYGDGKGDTTGGGEDRTDFRDWLLARIVTTGADGRASVSFDLSDDLTSWRVLASAVTPGLLAGRGGVSIPVGLPFFAEAIVAPEYLAVDRPVIRLRAYGTALGAGDPVTFRVSSDTLPMAGATARGTAFEPVEIALPRLAVGTHRLRIEASTGTGSTIRSDALVRTFEVVETRTTRSHTESVELVAATTVDGGSGLTRVTLVDAGRGRVVPLLRELAVAEPYRADRALAAAIARDLLAEGFGIPDSPGLPEPDLLLFQDDQGVGLLPYASADLELSAMAAFSGDPRVNRDRLHWYFEDSDVDDDGGMPVDRELYALLGRAALGEASIAEVTAAAARADLTPSQRVMVALAALAVGDDALARETYLDLLGRYGERLGPWVRVKVGTAEQTAIVTARLAIVAAALGDPTAAEMDAEVVAHPPADTLVELERAIAARYWADRMPKATAVAAVTIDGTRTERTITGDAPVMFAVTPAQRAGLRIDPVSGSVLVVSEWDGPVEADDLTPPAGQSLDRTVTPSGTIGPAQTVVVTFRVELGPEADQGCWRLTDLAPSGLVPIGTSGRWEEAEEDEGVSNRYVATPWRVVGQRVDFCVYRDPRRPVQTLRYLARVVTPGTYRWEPAVLQSSVVASQGTILPAFEVTIRGLGG
ncbi:MAG: hypothetical protein A2V85_10000 [Chloroflexi bacterium RBG_16_72_14]|nr:MAG: hypothetical protein A2V85_10000 [Chloroflexi bacterium RBG_16_72_14]